MAATRCRSLASRSSRRYVAPASGRRSERGAPRRASPWRGCAARFSRNCWLGKPPGQQRSTAVSNGEPRSSIPLVSVPHLVLLLRHVTEINKVVEKKGHRDDAKVVTVGDFEGVQSVRGDSLLDQVPFAVDNLF